MADRIGICAVAQTDYERAKDHQRHHEMLWEVVKKVVPEAGLSFDDIGAIITVSDDILDARTISDAAIGDIVGAHMRTEEKVAQDGAQAIYYAYATIVSGHADAVLVTAHAKESQPKSRNLITAAAFDPIFERLMGMDYVVAAALQARAYMEKFDIPPEAVAKAVVRSREGAAKNPQALLKEPITVDEVLASPLVADPLHEAEVYPVCDGACALVVAREEAARKLCEKPVWVTGIGNCYGAFYLGDRDLWRTESLEVAAKRAYEMAGMGDESSAFDLVELSDAFAHQQLLWLEGLGICGQGAAKDWFGEQGTAVNTSGGMLAGNPMMVSGLARVIECAIQLRGEAGDRQVSGAKRAVAQGATGPAGQHQTVIVLEA